MSVWVGDGQWNNPKGYHGMNRPQKDADHKQVTWLHSFYAIAWIFWTWILVDTLAVTQSNKEPYSFKMSSKTVSGTLLICKMYWICVSYLGFGVLGLVCGVVLLIRTLISQCWKIILIHCDFQHLLNEIITPAWMSTFLALCISMVYA